MELGDDGLRWITFIPSYGENRDLPKEEQLSLEIGRMRTVEAMAATGGDLARNTAWLESEKMKPWANHGEYGHLLKDFDAEALAVFKQFHERTRNFKNAVFEGAEVKDNIEVFLRSPRDLVSEITIAIGTAARLSGNALKNFVGRCVGIIQEKDAPPVLKEESRRDANTPQENTES